MGLLVQEYPEPDLAPSHRDQESQGLFLDINGSMVV
jgi:hypothetical protein